MGAAGSKGKAGFLLFPRSLCKGWYAVLLGNSMILACEL